MKLIGIYVFVMKASFFVGCYEEWNMQNHCKRTILVHGGELHFDSDRLPSTTRNCALTLQAERSGDRLSLFFTSYSMGVDCVYMNVTFIDGKSGKLDSELWPGLKRAMCSTDKYMNEQHLISTSGSSLTIMFRRIMASPTGKAHANFTMKVSSFRPADSPCDETNGTYYLCDNKRCIYRDLMCHNLNPCGEFYDICPDSSTQGPNTVRVVAPFLIILAGVIMLFFTCQVFLMIRNRKCPCKHKDYERQVSTASGASTQNGDAVAVGETDQFLPS